MKQKRMRRNDPLDVAFIIGSPRSGTTILENILNSHPEIEEWYEPYYIWEKYFHPQESDIWQDEFLNEKVKRAIQKEFSIFIKKSKKRIVLDKSPGHSFNIRIIHNIFPEAKWIHILRDGRDVTLSIMKEWDKRALIAHKRDFRGLLQVAVTMLQRQRYWRYRFMALHYELRSNMSFNPLKYLNKSKWDGKAGWGPRFIGWNEYLHTHSPLEFHAMQWVTSVEAVQDSWHILPEEDKVEIRYEDLLLFPEETLTKILDILEVDMPFNYLDRIPRLKSDNFHRWQKEFTPEQLRKIKPILSPLLKDLGYANHSGW
jgi:LPS sulfotransferase NodH